MKFRISLSLSFIAAAFGALVGAIQEEMLGFVKISLLQGFSIFLFGWVIGFLMFYFLVNVRPRLVKKQDKGTVKSSKI